MTRQFKSPPRSIFTMGILAFTAFGAVSCSGARVGGSHEQAAVLPTEQSFQKDTGRQVTLHVSGLRPEQSKVDEDRVCGIALNGSEALPKGKAKDKMASRLVCWSPQDKAGITTLELRDVPYPSDIVVFHDENANNILDFDVFDILLLRREGPAEEVGIVTQSDSENWPQGLSRPVWAEEGSNPLESRLRYEDLPFMETVKEAIWKFFSEVYTD